MGIFVGSLDTPFDCLILKIFSEMTCIVLIGVLNAIVTNFFCCCHSCVRLLGTVVEQIFWYVHCSCPSAALFSVGMSGYWLFPDIRYA